MLKIRIIIFVLVLVIGGLGFVYFTKGTFLPSAITQKLPFLQKVSETNITLPASLSSVKIPSLPSNTTAQLDVVKDRTGQVSETVGQVLGEAVKEASMSGENSLQERAFDYGRYLYCQQVVKEYDERQKK